MNSFDTLVSAWTDSRGVYVHNVGPKIELPKNPSKVIYSSLSWKSEQNGFWTCKRRFFFWSFDRFFKTLVFIKKFSAKIKITGIINAGRIFSGQTAMPSNLN